MGWSVVKNLEGYSPAKVPPVNVLGNKILKLFEEEGLKIVPLVAGVGILQFWVANFQLETAFCVSKHLKVISK